MAGPLDDGSDRWAARLAAEWELADARVRDLREELVAVSEATAAGPDDEHDAEGSTVAYERARVQALLAHAESVVAEIGSALNRSASQRAAGRSGMPRCQRCAAPIPVERLVALPATRTCVTCSAQR